MEFITIYDLLQSRYFEVGIYYKVLFAIVILSIVLLPVHLQLFIISFSLDGIKLVDIVSF